MTELSEHEQPEPVPSEEFPNGSFGHPPVPLPGHIEPCSPEDQALHREQLAAALSLFTVGAAIRRNNDRGQSAA